MNKIQTQYEKGTGKRATYRMAGKSSDYHTLDYVRWLETRLFNSPPELLEKYKEICEKYIPEELQEEASKKVIDFDGDLKTHKAMMKDWEK